jgi:hypothetical protein
VTYFFGETPAKGDFPWSKKKSPTDSPVPMGDEGNGMGELKAHLIGIFMQTWCQGMKDKMSYYR